MVDVQLLLTAVSDESPCGDDLEYDSAFLELERTAQGQPERQMGDSVMAAEPPDWRAVREQAISLLQRSKDLRISNYLVQSLVAQEGLPGLCQGLGLVRDLLTTFWDHVYPKLDADDNNDPTFRVNALSALAASEPMLRLIREANLVRSRAFGSVSLRAGLNAAGLVSYASETLTGEQIGGAFKDAEPDAVAALKHALSEAKAAVEAIEQEVSNRVGSSESVDLAPLKTLIKQAQMVVNEYAPAVDSESANDSPDSADDGASPSASAGSGKKITGDINGRDDVLRMLDKIMDYYSRHEPSSPVPMLLQRAKHLVTADFAAIVRNLLPDGLSQMENLRGPEPDNS